MPINYRTEVNTSLGINSFDQQQSTATVSNDNSSKTFISFLQSSSRFIEQIAANYSSLRAGINEGGLAYVEQAEGTQWLPYTLGGTYYPKGWYVWDGAEWVSSKSNVAATLDALGSGGGSSFSGDYNDLINLPTIPVDTQLSDLDIASFGYIKTDTNTQLTDSDIAAFGYIKTFTDTNTQLSDADITALGYIKTDTNTQLTDADITALGYIKTDTNTQLSDADITALGYVKNSGTIINLFQVQDDGITGQTVTNGYQNCAGFWSTPSITDSNFTFDNALGHLTVNTAGTLEVDAKLVSYQTGGNNRHELYIELQKNGVSLTSDAQYASRNNNQRVGGAYIMGYKVEAAIGDIFKLRTKRVGIAADIGVNTAAGMSYFSAKLYR